MPTFFDWEITLKLQILFEILRIPRLGEYRFRNRLIKLNGQIVDPARLLAAAKFVDYERR